MLKLLSVIIAFAVYSDEKKHREWIREQSIVKNGD